MKLRLVVGSSIFVFGIAATLNDRPPNFAIDLYHSRAENEKALAASIPLPAQGFFDDDTASPEDWTTYTLKGGALMCGLAGTDEEAGQLLNDLREPPSAESQWTGDLKQEMYEWYWHDVNPATYTCKLTDHWNIGYAMRSLGLNGKPKTEGGDNTCYRVEHWDPDKQENGMQTPAINQWYKVGNGEKEYRVCLPQSPTSPRRPTLTLKVDKSPLRIRHQPHRRWYPLPPSPPEIFTSRN